MLVFKQKVDYINFSNYVDILLERGVLKKDGKSKEQLLKEFIDTIEKASIFMRDYKDTRALYVVPTFHRNDYNKLIAYLFCCQHYGCERPATIITSRVPSSRSQSGEESFIDIATIHNYKFDNPSLSLPERYYSKYEDISLERYLIEAIKDNHLDHIKNAVRKGAILGVTTLKSVYKEYFPHVVSDEILEYLLKQNALFALNLAAMLGNIRFIERVKRGDSIFEPIGDLYSYFEKLYFGGSVSVDTSVIITIAALFKNSIAGISPYTLSALEERGELGKLSKQIHENVFWTAVLDGVINHRTVFKRIKPFRELAESIVSVDLKPGVILTLEFVAEPYLDFDGSLSELAKNFNVGYPNYININADSSTKSTSSFITKIEHIATRSVADSIEKYPYYEALQSARTGDLKGRGSAYVDYLPKFSAKRRRDIIDSAVALIKVIKRYQWNYTMPFIDLIIDGVILKKTTSKVLCIPPSDEGMSSYKEYIRKARLAGFLSGFVLHDSIDAENRPVIVEPVFPIFENVPIVLSGQGFGSPPKITDSYSHIEILGSGTYGNVSKMYKNGKFYAIKESKIRKGDKGLSPDFVIETSVGMLVKSPWVVRPHEINFTADGQYMVLPLYDGVMEHMNPLSTFDKKYVAYQLLLGLDALHSNGIMHLDIKGANVLIKEIDGRYVAAMSDFGIASVYSNPLSQNNWAVQTEDHRSPEVFGYAPYELAADIFSFGVILFTLFSERYNYFFEGGTSTFGNFAKFLGWRAEDISASNLFKSPNGKIMVRDGATRIPELVSSLLTSKVKNIQTLKQFVNESRDLPSGFQNIIEKCMALNVFDRPTARELLHDPFFTEIAPLFASRINTDLLGVRQWPMNSVGKQFWYYSPQIMENIDRELTNFNFQHFSIDKGLRLTVIMDVLKPGHLLMHNYCNSIYLFDKILTTTNLATDKESAYYTFFACLTLSKKVFYGDSLRTYYYSRIKDIPFDEDKFYMFERKVMRAVGSAIMPTISRYLEAWIAGMEISNSRRGFYMIRAVLTAIAGFHHNMSLEDIILRIAEREKDPIFEDKIKDIKKNMKILLTDYPTGA